MYSWRIFAAVENLIVARLNLVNFNKFETIPFCYVMQSFGKSSFDAKRKFEFRCKEDMSEPRDFPPIRYVKCSQRKGGKIIHYLSKLLIPVLQTTENQRVSRDYDARSSRSRPSLLLAVGWYAKICPRNQISPVMPKQRMYARIIITHRSRQTKVGRCFLFFEVVRRDRGCNLDRCS